MGERSTGRLSGQCEMTPEEVQRITGRQIGARELWVIQPKAQVFGVLRSGAPPVSLCSLSERGSDGKYDLDRRRP